MKSAGLTLLKIAIAVALAIYVVQQIETRDRVVCPGDGAGAAGPVHYGTLDGDWQGPDWVFRGSTGQVEYSPGTLGPCELRPGFFTILRGIRIEWYALTLGLWTVLLVIVGWRWQILLRAAGVRTSYGHAMRLCFIGYFFNNVMPGQTGGDIVRAVLVVRGLDSNRANAAMSVLIDRILGLFSLLFLAAIVLLFGGLDEGPGGPRHLGDVAKAVYLLVGGVVAFGAVYLSRRMRRMLKLDAILARLPERNFIRKIDGAITLYRHHVGAVFFCLAISMLLQVCGILSFWSMGQALGSQLTMPDNFVVFPVVQTVSAVPIAPAGWGLGETLYGTFFRWFGSSFTLGVAVSVLFRLTVQVGVGLIGGLVWVLSREHKQGLELDAKA